MTCGFQVLYKLRAGERALNRSKCTIKARHGGFKSGRRKEISPLQSDILLINPPLKGLKDKLPLTLIEVMLWVFGFI
jgi:hypothetical protein